MQEPVGGKVYLVGAGPGDPELLTLKAAGILKTADVVLYDRLVDSRILDCVNSAAQLICVGKERGQQSQIQQEIFDLLCSFAEAGRIVVRLKGGDPLVFGRGAEEWIYLRNRKIEVELVPGLSSSISVPAIAGIPLTCRGVSHGFAVVTGNCCKGLEQDWSRYARVDTLVVLMGAQRRQWIARALISRGRGPQEPVAFIERGATLEQRVAVSTLEEVASGTTQVESPMIMVVGEVVRLREHLKAVVEDHQPSEEHREAECMTLGLV